MYSQIDIERALYQQELSTFIRGHAGLHGAWHLIEPGTVLDWGWHLDAVCEHLEAVSRGEIRNLVVTVPPRTLKTTTISTCWPAWEWITRPSTKIIGAGYDKDIPVDAAVKTRWIIESHWYQNRWNDVFRIVSDQNVKSYYRNSEGGERRAVSVGGSSTGKGADIIICDDPINVRDSHNELAIEKALTWWTEVMPSRLNDQRTGRRVVVMQRVHEKDVAGWCIEHGYEHLNLPMEFDPSRRCIVKTTGWEDPRTEPGELLIPGRMGEEQVAALKESMRSYAYAAQYQQEPAPDDGSAMFPPSSWQRWRTLPVNEDGTLRQPSDAFCSWDMTFDGKSAKQSGRSRGEPDYVVGQLWYAYGADMYLIDETRGQWSYAQTKRAVRDFHQASIDRHPFAATRHIVERKANGAAIISELKGEIPGLVGFMPDKYGDKLQRAWYAQPRVEAGQIHLPDNAGWVDDWMHELRMFPNGANDDRVDAFSQAVIASAGGRRGWRAG